MSLINDALREAERERSSEGGTRTTGPFVESLFPDADARKNGPPRSVFVGAGIATLVIGLAAAGMMRNRVGGRSAAKPAEPSVAIIQAGSPRPAVNAPIVVTDSRSASPAPSKTPPPPPVQASLPRPMTERPASATRTSLVAKADPPAQPVAADTLVAAAPQTNPAADSVTSRPAGDSADSLFRLAYAEQMKSNLDVAQALYERAIATEHAPAEAYNDYGVLLLARGNKTAAAEMFRRTLNHDDKSIEAWVNLGDSFSGMEGHHAEAMTAYARANQLDPTRAAVKTRLSREFEAIGDTASAHRYLEDAIRVSPNDAAAHYALGTYLQRARDYRGAIREFETIVDLSPGPDGQEFVAEMQRHISALKRFAP